MGVRITKQVGYGIQGVVLTNLQESQLYKVELTLPEFIKWCQSPECTILKYLGTSPLALSGWKWEMEYCNEGRDYAPPYIQSCITYVHGNLLLTPPTMWHLWYRYNSEIDWHEETLLHDQENHWHEIPNGLLRHAKMEPPPIVLAMLLWLGAPDLWGRLRETLYCFWS